MSRIHYKNYRGITLLCRQLRKNPTPSEKKLWETLRKKGLDGYKFLRQHPVFYRIDREWVEFFVADFYCSKLKLIIELDGEIHKTRQDYDSERDAKLLSKDIFVVRILNDELNDLKSLTDKLLEELKVRAQYIIDNKMIVSPSLRLKGRGWGKG
jgi:leucyl-tRNA synthetase